MIIVIVGSLTYSLVLSLYLMMSIKFNPRLWLQDYPKKVISKVQPKSDNEIRQATVIGLIFIFIMLSGPIIINMLYSNYNEITYWKAYLISVIVLNSFNVVDLLILDMLIFHYIIPKFIRVKGAEDKQLYKGIKMHLRGFVIGLSISVVASFAIAAIIIFI